MSCSLSVGAQEILEPPPIRPSVDVNGVELFSGRLRYDRTDIVIGQSGAGGSNVGASSSSDYEEFGYDSNSQITSTRTRGGTVILTPRDALGRVMVKDVPLNAEDVHFSYDNQGRLRSALYNDVAGNGISQTYDGLGRLETRTVFGRQLSYHYDLGGRRDRLTYPDGFYVTYGYTNTDELQSITDSTGTVLASYVYDALGARTGL
jgi:YD repeat-containing protein